MPQTPTNKIQPDTKNIPFRINIDESDVSERIYSNHIELTTSPLDVTLSFCDIDPTKKISKVDEVLQVEAKLKSRIVLTYDIFYSLAELIAVRFEAIKKEREGK